MGHKLIRVSSRAAGERRYVSVYVYDTVEEMRAAGERYNGSDLSGAGGCTQMCTRIWIHEDGTEDERGHQLIVRLHRKALGTGVVTHEMNHAAVAIYGSTLPRDTLAVDILDNANETLAYLQSDLTVRLVDRLYELGYYQ